MPERPPDGDGDRFGDLGAGAGSAASGDAGAGSGRTPEGTPRGGQAGSAAERFAERDELDAAAESEKRPGPPRPSSRYAWFLGFVFVIVGAAALANQIVNLRDDSSGALKGPQPGSRLPAFAAPLATGDVEGDANVRQDAGGDDNAGAVPACEVKTEGVLNSCELRKRPVVLTFVFDQAANCEPQVDRVERMKGSFPGVAFATVFFSRKDRAELEEIVRRREWTQPVAIDHDGAVSNLLGVGGCPVTVFALRGGKVMETKLGNLTEDQLRATVRRLQRRSGAAGS